MAGVQAVLSLLQEVEAASDQLRELQVGTGPANLWGTQQSGCPSPALVLTGIQHLKTAMTTYLWPGASQLHDLCAASGRSSGAASET